MLKGMKYLICNNVKDMLDELFLNHIRRDLRFLKVLLEDFKEYTLFGKMIWFLLFLLGVFMNTLNIMVFLLFGPALTLATVVILTPYFLIKRLVKPIPSKYTGFIKKIFKIKK